MKAFIIAAISADGFIAQNENQSSIDWTSKADKQFFQQKTTQAGICLFGRTTYQTIGQPLPNRLNIVYTNNPNSVPDSLPLTKEAVNQEANTFKPLTTNLPPRDLVQFLSDNQQPTTNNQLAICGGASIYTQFLQSGVVDSLYLSVHPVVFGSGIKLYNKDLHQRLNLVDSKKLEDSQTVLLEYHVNNLPFE